MKAIPPGWRMSLRVVGVGLAALVVGVLGASPWRSHRSPPVTGPAPALPERIAFVRQWLGQGLRFDVAELVAIQPDGRASSAIRLPAASVGSLAWSSDRVTVAFVQRMSSTSEGGVSKDAGLYVMGAGGTGLRRLAPCAEVLCSIRELAWSPDGTKLAFAEWSTTKHVLAVRVVNADGSNLHDVCQRLGCPQVQGQPAWSPDGESIVFADLAFASFGGFKTSAFGALYVARADGSSFRKLTGKRCPELCGFDFAPTWLPDGLTIAFARERGNVVRLSEEVLLIDRDGTAQTRFWSCPPAKCHGRVVPVWSGDGHSVALVNLQEPRPNLRVLSVDGSGSKLLQTCTDSSCITPTALVWSPDGSQLAFVTREEPVSIYVMGSDGSELRLLAEDVHCCLAWLP